MAMSLCLSRRGAVVPCTRSRAVAPALVRRVDTYRSPRLVQARSNLPKSDEATETPATETQAVDKATVALGFIGALALSGAISIATGIVPASALAGPISYKTFNVTTYNIPPAVIYQRFVAANNGCNVEVQRNAAGQVIDLKYVYVVCPPGVSGCTAYPYPTFNPLYESQITTPKYLAASQPPPQFAEIWLRCFV